MINFIQKKQNLVPGNDRWLLQETKGNTLFDKFILNSLKLIYLIIRILFRIVLGKKRRDNLFSQKKFTFGNFLYSSIEFLKLDHSILLIFNVSKYNFKFYSRITRKVNNLLIHDVFNSMQSHEEEILEQFSPKEGDIVVDVGAAFGFYTILAAKKVGQSGKVVAIEPQPESFRLLNYNIKLNKLSNVVSFNYAIYSNETTLKLYSTYSTISERAGENTTDFVEVQGKTLDSLLSKDEKIKEVNWIKIDVEGAELEVLKGAMSILSKSKDISLLIEIHGRDKITQIMEILHSLNLIVKFEKNYDNGDKHIIARKIYQ